MPRCPKCKSKDTHCTNWDERLIGNVAGSAAGFFMGMLNPSMATPAHVTARRNVCPYKKYKCNNCGKEWSVNQ